MMSNEFIKYIQAMVAVEKQKDFAKKPILTLGEAILLLKAQPQENRLAIDFIQEVNPYGVASYRGFYEDLAIEYAVSKPAMKVKDLLSELEFAVGKTYEGYKGGDFEMTRSTIVWVSPYGHASRRMLVGFETKDDVTTILTKLDEDNL